MEKTQAIELVRKTLTQPFEKERFNKFVRELLNRFDEGKAASMTVPDAFAAHVRSCWRLGTYKSPDGELADVLIVNTTEAYKLERTRTGLRDFVAHKLKRQDSYKEAGLVAFVSPDLATWRFSYVKMEYESKRDPKTGKIKAEERLTPARRYSFLVGSNENSHTAQKQLVPLLQQSEEDPSLTDIEQAFGVESVTKEFFREYARLFEITEASLADLVKRDKVLRADFETKNVSTVDFTKKLLGQIVFLYFIQKKGWLGVPKGGKWGDGPRDFLRQLTNQAIEKKKCLFNDILEPLFYDTLATDRGHEAWCKTFQCRIPFLNGGLFEPLAGYDWEKTEINLPNSIFTNHEQSPQGDTGTGILDVFDRYNFTVNEAEPLEKEVAIDPEMLGKVFENLIEENRRKGLGAFYTPREIVHYMCQESLTNYLDTGLNGSADTGEQKLLSREELVEWIRQSDQFAHYAEAIAAGTKGDHYPKPPETIRKYAREIDDLLRDITVCDPAIGSGAFPVGMMTEIVRARAALTPYFNDIAERTIYHFKRHAIQNSLYGVDIDVGAVEIAKLRLWLSLVVDEEDVQQIKPLPNLDYKIVVGNSLMGVEKNLFNHEQFNRLEELKPKFFNESDRRKKAQFKKQIEVLIHDLTNGREVFDFDIYFSEVFHAKKGFNVVIANPPYIFSRENLTKEDKTLYKKCYSLTQFKINLYILFIEKSYHLMNKKGCFAFIIPNNWLTLSTTSDLRRFILSNTYDINIMFNYDNVFECASVDTCILTFKKSGDPILNGYRWTEKGILKISSQDVEFYLRNSNHLISNVNVEADGNYILCEKINSQSKPLSFCAEVSNGVQAYTVGEGDPVQSQQMKLDRVYHSNTKKGGDWIKYFDGVDVGKYRAGWSGQFIKYGKNLSRQRKPELFTGERLLVRQIPSKPPYCIFSCYVDEAAVNDNNSMIIRASNAQINIKYILGVLSSRLISFWFIHTFGKLQRKTFPQFKVKELRIFPIREVLLSAQEPIINLVNKILINTKDDGYLTNQAKQSEVRELEKKIDHLVYKLYGLTKEEIEIVEGRVEQ